MDIGIFSKVFKDYSLKEAFERIKDYGLSVIQFNFVNVGLPSLPDEIDDEIIQEIIDTANDVGIEIPVVSGTFNTLELEKDKLDQNIQRFGVVVEAARKIGIQFVSISTGSFNQEDFWSPHPDNHTEKAWEHLYYSLDRMLEIAEKNEVTIVVEPEQANVVSTAEDALRLLNHYNSPYLKVLYDAANVVSTDDVNSLNDKINDTLEQLSNHIAIAHLKDAIVTKDDIHFASVGKGNLPLNSYLQELRKYYKGPVIMHGLEENDINDALESINI